MNKPSNFFENTRVAILPRKRMAILLTGVLSVSPATGCGEGEVNFDCFEIPGVSECPDDASDGTSNNESPVSTGHSEGDGVDETAANAGCPLEEFFPGQNCVVIPFDNPDGNLYLRPASDQAVETAQFNGSQWQAPLTEDPILGGLIDWHRPQNVVGESISALAGNISAENVAAPWPNYRAYIITALAQGAVDCPDANVYTTNNSVNPFNFDPSDPSVQVFAPADSDTTVVDGVVYETRLYMQTENGNFPLNENIMGVTVLGSNCQPVLKTHYNQGEFVGTPALVQFSGGVTANVVSSPQALQSWVDTVPGGLILVQE